MLRRALAVICSTGLLMAACSGGDDSADGVSNQDLFDPEVIPDMFDPTVDDPICIDVGEGLGQEVDVLPIAPCDQLHSHEIFGVPTYTEPGVTPGGEVYPGVDVLEAFAQRTCLVAFEVAYNESVFDSAYFMSWLVPTLDSWEDDDIGDRKVICVAGCVNGALVSEPIAGRPDCTATST